MTPRAYQNNFVNNIAAKLGSGIRKVLGQLATGGKDQCEHEGYRQREIACSAERFSEKSQ